MTEVSVMIEGGKATPAAPLGPALGPLGVNIVDVVQQINEKTKAFVGMKVPVKIMVDSKKNVEIEVGSPPISSIIKKELNIQKGAGNPKTEQMGSLSFDQIKKIAEMKGDSMNSTELEKNMREVIGACNSMGVWVEGKPAKQVQEEIDSGQHLDLFKTTTQKHIKQGKKH
ncbi:50S ribosomal protein L11 [Candidatus Micrarchaeota archaeon]|nr:50S ribosomal protein L11 [Candidatus Micrarchaeota archaeon]MBU1930030.1 50S ribosomal protein L11 [Candidatus Micrarchaeota archaeon]